MKLLPTILSLSLAFSLNAAKAQEHTGNYNYHSGSYESSDTSSDDYSIPAYNYSPSYNYSPPAPVNNQYSPFGMVKPEYDKTYSYPGYSFPVAAPFQPWSQSTQPVDYGRIYPGSFSYGGSSSFFNPTPSYNYYRPAPSSGVGLTYQYIFR